MRRRFLVVLGAVGCLLLGDCARPVSRPSPALIAAMRGLTVAPVLTKDAVETALETDLGVNASSHEMVTFFVGGPRPGSRFEKLVKVVDLRVPTPRNDVMRDPFLHVDLREDSGITAGDVETVLGRPAELNVPEPNGDTKVNYLYAFGPHRLWVGVGHGATEPLRGFSVHRNEAPSGR